MKLDHIALNVYNISESVSWYVEYFKAHVVYQDLSWAMLEIGDTKMALTQASQHPPHIAFRVDSDLLFPCKPSEIRVHRDGSRYYYQRDPDGNTIEWIRYPDQDDED